MSEPLEVPDAPDPIAGSVEERVVRFVAAHGTPPPGAKVVVGCSGGADSTALLLALAARHRGPLLACYVDHGLRAGTDGEAARVAALAAGAGAGFARTDVHVFERGNRMARAREARYRALAAVAREAGARHVAVGHTATDQAETVVFRAARGDPGVALAGMPPVRALDGDLVLLRPLLAVRRDEARAYAFARGGLPVDDPTNERDEYTRNRIRREVEAARAEEPLLRLAARAAEAVAALDGAALALGPLEGLDAASVAAAGEAVALRLLRRAGLHRAGAAHARALLSLAGSGAGSKRLDLGDGLVAERCYERLRIGRLLAGAALDAGPVAIDGAGRYRLLGRTVSLALAEPRGGADALDAALVGPLDGAGLVLRAPRPGDRLRLPVGRRKLHDVLIDRKVPRALRPSLPVLARPRPDGDGDEVLWALGAGPAPALRDRSDGGRAIVVSCDPDLAAAGATLLERAPGEPGRSKSLGGPGGG